MKKNDLKVTSYQKFLELLEKKGVTAYKVSKECEISKPTFTYWKQGKLMPKTETLLKIANYLEVSIEEFL